MDRIFDKDIKHGHFSSLAGQIFKKQMDGSRCLNQNTK